jgi:hypothetical protein
MAEHTCHGVALSEFSLSPMSANTTVSAWPSHGHNTFPMATAPDNNSVTNVIRKSRPLDTIYDQAPLNRPHIILAHALFNNTFRCVHTYMHTYIYYVAIVTGSRPLPLAPDTSFLGFQYVPPTADSLCR